MKLVGNVFLVAGNEHSLPSILELLASNAIETHANPDLEVRTYTQFLVDDARRLCERAASRPLQSERRIFVTVTSNLTYEAQNTLLKTLEEPPANALFFFVVPSPTALLSTVRSRAQVLELDTAATNAHDVQTFLKMTPQKRLDMLKPFLEKGEDDVRDISGVITFLAALERELATQQPSRRAGIEAVYRARKYLGDKGSMLKPLLEQVALLA